MLLTFVMAVWPVHAADKTLYRFTSIVTKYLDEQQGDSLQALISDLERNVEQSMYPNRSSYRARYAQARQIYLKQKNLVKSLQRLKSTKIDALRIKDLARELRTLRVRISTTRQFDQVEQARISKSFADILLLLNQNQEVFLAEAEALQVSLLANPLSPGIYGITSVIYGDCMPKYVSAPATCHHERASHKVTIRRPVTYTDLVDYVYLQNPTELVAEAVSDENGFFEIDLEPGIYSVFVDDNGQEYCNRFSVDGYACLLEINSDRKILRNLEIDHATW